MKPFNAETLGAIADIVDTLAGSLVLDVPPALHVDTMRRHLPLLRDSLRQIVINEIGFNPWETSNASTAH